MNYGFFTFIWDNVAQRIQQATAGLINALLGYVGPQFQACVLAYLIITLLIATWSADETAMLRFFRQLFLAVVIYGLATNAGTFNTYVQSAVNGIVTGVTNAIAGVFGGNGNVTANSFDDVAVKMFAAGLKVIKNLSWTAPVQSGLLGLTVIAYWLISLAAIVIIFLAYISSAVVTGFLVAFGPLFIACYFFPFARKFFEGWLSCVVAGMLTQIFTVGWLVIFINSLQGMMQTMQNGITAAAGDSVDDVATQIFTLILAGFLVSIFSTMTGISALMAIRISGGFHAQLRSGFGFSRGEQAQNSTPAPLTASGGGSIASGGSPGPTGTPSRQHAFQRTVGSAP